MRSSFDKLSGTSFQISGIPFWSDFYGVTYDSHGFTWALTHKCLLNPKLSRVFIFLAVISGRNNFAEISSDIKKSQKTTLRTMRMTSFDWFLEKTRKIFSKLFRSKNFISKNLRSREEFFKSKLLGFQIFHRFDLIQYQNLAIWNWLFIDLPVVALES